MEERGGFVCLLCLIDFGRGMFQGSGTGKEELGGEWNWFA